MPRFATLAASLCHAVGGAFVRQAAQFGDCLSTSTMAKFPFLKQHTWRSYWWLPILLACSLWLLVQLAGSYRRSRHLQQQMEQQRPHSTHSPAGAHRRAGCPGLPSTAGSIHQHV